MLLTCALVHHKLRWLFLRLDVRTWAMYYDAFKKTMAIKNQHIFKYTGVSVLKHDSPFWLMALQPSRSPLHVYIWTIRFHDDLTIENK
jgi:hypothetical protein